LWLHSLKVAQLLRSAACLHTNQSRSYLNHLVLSEYETLIGPKYVRQTGVFNYLPLLQVWLSILILKKDEHKITDSSQKI